MLNINLLSHQTSPDFMVCSCQDFTFAISKSQNMPERRAKELHDHRGSSSAGDHDDGRKARIKRQKIDYSEGGGNAHNDEDEDEGSQSDEDQLCGSGGGGEEGESEVEHEEGQGEIYEQLIEIDEAAKNTTKKNSSLLKLTSKEASRDSDIITPPHYLTPLTPSQLKASRQAVKRTGVVYLSRLPPFMRPQKVKFLLSRFGEIGRIFLSPEDPKSHARRVKFGGNKRVNYEEGWVEFKDKKVAKLVAETLSATTIGGKKGNYYHDDVWNIKYLPKFKWHHLQAQIGMLDLFLPLYYERRRNDIR